MVFKAYGQKIVSVILLVFSVFILSCSHDGNNSRGLTYSGYADKADSTIVLGTATLDSISSVQTDGTIVFSSKPDDLKNAAVGSAVIITVCDMFPNGALVKIDAMESTSTGFAVHTSAAALDQAVSNADISMHKDMSSDDVSGFVPLKSGVAIEATAASNSLRSVSWQMNDIVINLNNTILIDGDANPLTTYDQIRANGKITISPSFDMDAKISWFKLKKFMFKNKTKEVADLFISNGDINTPVVSIKKDIEVARIAFAPIVFTVGAVPVVITPNLIVRVGVEGSISYEIDAGLHQTADLELGVQYDNGSWSTTKGLTLGLSLVDPKIQAQGKIKGYVSPEFDLLLYGVLGPYVNAQGYLECVVTGTVDGTTAVITDGQVSSSLTGSEVATLAWQLNAGFSSDVGVKFTLLSSKILDYHMTIYNWKKPIADGYISGSVFYDKNGLVSSGYTVKL